jgi:50S ribosomal protein L16 3-hydroxylase
MSLSAWLGGAITVTSFRERVLGGEAYAGLGLAREARHLFDWCALERLLASGTGSEVDLLTLDGLVPHPSRLDLAGVGGVLASGCGLRLRGAESKDPELGSLAEAFGRDLSGHASVQLLALPRRGAKLAWRRLSVDAFFAQTEGSCEHHFRPSVGRSRRASELAHSCSLEPGDWLYVPRGWWHRTDAIDLSLTILIELARPWSMRSSRAKPNKMSSEDERLANDIALAPWTSDSYRASTSIDVDFEFDFDFDVKVRRAPKRGPAQTALKLLWPRRRRYA